MAEPKPTTARAPHAPTPTPDPFGLWLRVSLRRAHDAVAAEPVPEALRRLAGGDASGGPPPSSGAGVAGEHTP
jgi:hypothetical protein